jgi:hypothetical protein
MKIKSMPPAGAPPDSGMEENPNPWGLAHPCGHRRPASSRADRPARLKPQNPRLDPARPARLIGWRDDGDGMDQARPALCAASAIRERPENAHR